MSKPKVFNPPATIYLQVGDIEMDCEFSECAPHSGQVTWCVDRIKDTDIEYRVVRAGANFRSAQGKGTAP